MSDEPETESPEDPQGGERPDTERAEEPRLPELLLPLWRRLGLPGRIGAVLVVAVVVGLMIAYQAQRRAGLERVTVEPAEAPAFTFTHTDSLPPVEPLGGELVRLESRDQEGALVNRMTIVPLQIEERPATIGARLPLDAIPYARRAEERYDGYRPELEGRTRLNGVEGYQIAFTARYTDPAGLQRRMLGKVVLVPEPTDDPTRGLAVEMLATSLAGVPQAAQVGNRGALTRPYRSLRLLEPEA